MKSSSLVLFLTGLLLSACTSDEETEEVVVRVNGTALVSNGDDFDGDIDGDFSGSGGSTLKTFNWVNSSSTAEYNADITTSSAGKFRMIVKDSENKTVLDRTLNGSTEPDSFSGVTSAGTSGKWSVTINLTSFNGDGSFSLSEGD